MCASQSVLDGDSSIKGPIFQDGETSATVIQNLAVPRVGPASVLRSAAVADCDTLDSSLTITGTEDKVTSTRCFRFEKSILIWQMKVREAIQEIRSMNVIHWAFVICMLLPMPPALAQRAPEIPRSPNLAHRDFLARAWRRITPHAVIRSDMGYGNEDQVSARIESVVRQARTVFSPDQRESNWERVEVYLTASRNDYLSVLKVETGADGTGSGGMHCWRSGEPQRVFVHGDSWPVLQHELWHAVVRQDLVDCPKWLNEGLAEIFEEGVFVGDQLVLGGVSSRRLPAARDLVSRTGEPLRIFFQRDAVWNSRLRTGRDSGTSQYTQAWLLMHFLLFADDGGHRSRVNCLLQRLQQSRSGGTAIHDCIGMGNLPDLEREMNRFVGDGLKASDPVAFGSLLLDWAERTQGGEAAESVSRLSDLKALRRDVESLLTELPATQRNRLPLLDDCHVQWNSADRTAILRFDASDGNTWVLNIPALEPKKTGATASPRPTIRWLMD